MNIDPQTIELDEQQRAELAALSEQFGKPWSAVQSEALADYRERHPMARWRGKPIPKVAPGENFLEAAERLGLIGCISGGPAELSTNPAHMEGFGRDDR